MYIHIGNNTVIDEERIIAVFDLDNLTKSKISGEFLKAAEKNRETVNVWGAYDLPKSLVICDDAIHGTKVYISPITAQTILKRSKNGSVINN